MIPTRTAPRLFLLLSAIVPCLLSPDPGAGQTVDSLRSHWRLEVPEPARRSAPSMGLTSPIAFGARWGDVYAGASFATRARYIDDVDGSVAVGFGLGDPQKLAGLEVNAISFSTFRSGWGSNMALDIKLHRALPGQLAVAVGWEGALVRGEIDGGRSVYLAVSRWFRLKPSDPTSPLMVVASLGAGDGRFRLWEDWVDDVDRIGVFGSVALRFSGPASLVLDWTGQDAMAAVSVAPLARVPVILTAGAADLFGIPGDGPRVVMSAGLSLRFR